MKNRQKITPSPNIGPKKKESQARASTFKKYSFGRDEKRRYWVEGKEEKRKKEKSSLKPALLGGLSRIKEEVKEKRLSRKTNGRNKRIVKRGRGIRANERRKTLVIP